MTDENEIKKDTVDYRDPTPFYDTKLNSISEISKGIRHKNYGKDVREALAQQGEALVKLIQETGGNQAAEVIAARGNHELLSMREDAQDNAIATAQSTANGKFDTNQAESYLKSITALPETFSNLAAIKAKYPSGKNGLMVAADNGHKYIWENNVWTDAGVYQSVGIADHSVDKAQIAYRAQYGEIVCSHVSVDFDQKRVDITHCVQINANTDRFLIGEDVVVQLEPSDKVGFFIGYSTNNTSFIVKTNVTDFESDDIYLGWIDLSSKTYNIHANDVDIANKPNFVTNFVIASKYPAIIDIGKRTLQIPQEGYCNLFFANGKPITLSSNNKHPIDFSGITGAQTASTFVFVNEINGIISGKSTQVPGENETLIGWITWTGSRNEYYLSGLTADVVNTPSKIGTGGLNAVAIGDSITWSYNSAKWANIVSEMLNLNSMDIQGIPGSTYAVREGHDDSAVEKISGVNSDLILIAYGINDFYSNIPLGEFGNSDTKTFYGALETTYSTVLENNPSARIMVITPMKTTGYNQLPDSYTENNQGLIEEDYVNAMQKVASKYGLPIIDLYNNAGMSPFSSAQSSLYFRDGLHPNQAGEYIYARKVIEAINALS